MLQFGERTWRLRIPFGVSGDRDRGFVMHGDGGQALANFIVGKSESMMIEFSAKFVFRVGREIDQDRVVDYAERLGIDAADAEKNLAANLGYL